MMFSSVLSIMGFSCALLGLSSQGAVFNMRVQGRQGNGVEKLWNTGRLHTVFYCDTEKKAFFKNMWNCFPCLPSFFVQVCICLQSTKNQTDKGFGWSIPTPENITCWLLQREGMGSCHQLLTSYPSTYLPDPSSASFHCALHLKTPCKQWGWTALLQNA